MYYLLLGISCFAVMKSCQPFNSLRLFLVSTTTIGSFAAAALFHNLLSIGTMTFPIFGYFVLLMIVNVLVWKPLAKRIAKMNFAFL